MAQAYYASCQTDKMHAAIQRGLEINPDDPNLLAAFGNWLQYAGRWEAGTHLTARAFAIEPKKYKKWWWMGQAKSHYFHGEHEQAYQVFMRSFNERNWLSHLQLAYTLPYLGRVDEAKAAIKDLHRLLPMFDQLEIDDHHSAVEVMIENVFELEPGSYALETESTKELTRYNAPTLKLRFGEMNKGGTKLTCDYLQQVRTPTLVVLGEKTHKYWKLMSKKFAECTPNAKLSILESVNHQGPLLKVSGFSKLILDFVEVNKQ